jgi:hypothetical protein
MPSLQGIDTNIGIGIAALADPYGTALAVTEKLIVESISWNENVNRLESAGIGSGGSFSDNIARGSVAGSITIDGICGYDNGFPLMLATFLGESTSVPAEQNVGEGDYFHSLEFNRVLNRTWFTLALESSDASVLEFPSVTITDVTISAAPGDFMRYSITALFSELAGTGMTTANVNNNATLQGLSESDSEKAVVEFAEIFLINGQAAGALANPADLTCITDFSLNMARSQEFIAEICDTTGNSKPVASDKATGSLTIGLKEHDDANVWEIAAQAGTEYKALLDVQGTQIASGDNRTIVVNMPRLKLVDTPDFSLASAGLNPVSLTFDVLDAAANPTGMTETRPYLDITNERAAAYVA